VTDGPTGGREAVAFYERAFGAVEIYRVGGTDEHEDVVSVLRIGASTVWVSDEAPEYANHSPESLGGGSVRMLLQVEDPVASQARAVEAGAKEIWRVTEEYGWQIGRVADPYGHHWEIARPLGPWPPAHEEPTAG
jgi:PhnB protein